MNANPEWLGASPEEIVKGLEDFSKSSKFLSTNSELVNEYPQKWIGVFSGEVKAAEDDLGTLLDTLDRQGIPRSRTIVRFMDTTKRTLIL